MTEAEFARYRAHAIPSLADAQAEAFGDSLESATRAAARAFERFEPGGPAGVPDHHLFTILDGETAVGSLWFEIRRGGDGIVDAYLLDIVIDDESRGRGVGSAAMAEFERRAAGLGAPRVSLNVFAANTAAASLYTSLGYHVTSSLMTKRIVG